MATIATLVSHGLLIPFSPPLGAREQPLRRMFGTAEFVRWAKHDLPQIEATFWGGDVSAKSQVADLLRSYVTGAPLDHSRQFHCLKPWDQGVWELKTDDVRMFGWFPEFDCFIAAKGGDATAVKQSRLYGQLIGDVIMQRDALPLDDPKFIQGEDWRNVISN